MTAGNPLYTASHMQMMASRAANEKLAFAMTGLSVALLGAMVFREFRDCFFSHKGHYPDRGRSR